MPAITWPNAASRLCLCRCSHHSESSTGRASGRLDAGEKILDELGSSCRNDAPVLAGAVMLTRGLRNEAQYALLLLQAAMRATAFHCAVVSSRWRCVARAEQRDRGGTKLIADGGEDGDEPLQTSLRPKARHCPLALSQSVIQLRSVPRPPMASKPFDL